MDNNYSTSKAVTTGTPPIILPGGGAAIGKIIGFMAQGLGTAIGGSPVGLATMLIGFGLSFIKKGDDLDSQQLAELKQINTNLLGVRQDLGLLDSDLKGIEETLEQILGQAKLGNWLSKENTIADALAHIETDFETYQAYMVPQTNGQLQHIPAAQIELLSARAYNSAGLTDEEAVTKIQQAITGSGAGDGLLDLYATLLADYLTQKNPAKITSDDLSFVANALLCYYSRFLAFQLNGMAVVIECKNYDGITPQIMGQDWQDFLDSVTAQSEIFLDAMWTLISVWRNVVQQNQTWGSGGNFGLPQWLFGDDAVKNFSNNDLLAFLSGGPVTNSNEGSWRTANYASTLSAPEQDYLTKAENIVAACFLPADTGTTKGRRIVIHALFYIGMYANDQTSGVFSQPMNLQNVSAAPVVDVRKATVGNFQPSVTAYLVRQVFDLGADGSYQMSNMNDSYPKWNGYSGNFRFQSDADLALTATVNAANPVGIIRFVPYVQTA